MIRAAVVSAADEFHRALRRHSPESGVRLHLIVRTAAELTSAAGLDVVILHRPSDGDIEYLRSVMGALPVVFVDSVLPDHWLLEELDGWAALPDDDPGSILAAAHAAAMGMVVVPADEAERIPGGRNGPSEVTERRRASGATADLTVREMDVLRLVASGATNHEVADTLGISENTVKYHLGSLYSKLGVTRRSEMTFEAIRRGLITI